jgi:transposase
MQLKVILNRIQKYRSFVYGPARFGEDQDRGLYLEVEIYPRLNSKPVCSGCKRRRPGYDLLSARYFEFVPLWGILVFFVYVMRRVNCPKCGIVVEEVPWARGKSQLTTTYEWFLASWAKRMSWSEVAKAFRTSWDSVYRSVQMAVAWGREHMDLEGVTAIGVDEIAYKRGHKYFTVIYQLDAGSRRLLWVGIDRKVKTLLRFFRWFGKSRTAGLRFVCSDMWQPYLKVIAKKATQAVHILDRFHVVANMNKAIDKVRAEENRDLRAKGKRLLTGTRWCFLKKPENLTEMQDRKLADLLRCNLRTVRAYLLKEDFQFLWTYKSPFWAGAFLDTWCTRVMRSRIEPMKRIARSLRIHRDLILNWFRARGSISAAVVEGFNNKAKLTTRKAYGYRNPEIAMIALYHSLGNLPEPQSTHRFC